MNRRIPRILVSIITALATVPALLVSPPRVALATTTDGAIVGVTPGWNLDSFDASMGPDIGTFGSCAGNPKPGYVHDMNDWQGKHNTVIQFYGGLDDTTTTNNFAYANPCNNSQFIPWIWDKYDAIPMQTGQLAPPTCPTSSSCNDPSTCADGTTNPYACFSDSTGSADNEILQTYGQTLNHWLNGPDAFGVANPPGGRRFYIRFDWENNGTWVPWGPAYAILNSNVTPPTYTPVYADNCTHLFNTEMFNVAWFRYVRNKVDSYITPPAGVSVDQEVGWVYSQYAYDPLWATNSLGQYYFPDSVRHCTSQTNTVYSSTHQVNPSDLIQATYPGDDVTGWTGLDGYGTCTTATVPIPSPSTVFTSPVFGNYVTDLHNVSTKPVSIDEVGVGIRHAGTLCSTAPVKTQWLNDYMAFVQANNVRMSIWFNDDENSADGGVDDMAVFCPFGSDSECTTDQTANNVYQGSDTGTPVTYGIFGAYRQGLQGSWWEAPDPAQDTTVPSNTNARVMDDATFQGSW